MLFSLYGLTPTSPISPQLTYTSHLEIAKKNPLKKISNDMWETTTQFNSFFLPIRQSKIFAQLDAMMKKEESQQQYIWLHFLGTQHTRK